jgi:hypothetical protein
MDDYYIEVKPVKEQIGEGNWGRAWGGGGGKFNE